MNNKDLIHVLRERATWYAKSCGTKEWIDGTLCGLYYAIEQLGEFELDQELICACENIKHSPHISMYCSHELNRTLSYYTSKMELKLAYRQERILRSWYGKALREVKESQNNKN